MFCEVHQALNTIINFSENCDYSEKEKKFVKTLDYSKFETILRMINDQDKIINKQYSLYKQKYNTMKFEYVCDVVNTNEQEYHTVIDSTDEELILNALSPECLCNYILDNQAKNNIFITLNYGSNLHDSAHQSILMIDNKAKKIYMIDPNGKSDFFDSVFMQETNFYVEIMLSKYFSQLEKFGLNYKYVYVNEWNKENIALNKNFKNDYIGTGNCVIITLLIINILTIFNIQPGDAFVLINNLSNDELLYFIKQYSLGVYNILRNK